MGCHDRTFGSGSSTEGSFLAYKNVHRGSQNVCSPAIGSLLSVAKSFPHEQMDGKFDKKGLHYPVRQPPATIQRGSGVGHIVSGRISCSDDRVDGAHEKRAISRVPAGKENKGFYSRYSLLPKKTGGMRPILHLSFFNKFIVKWPFHMLTTKHVLVCPSMQERHQNAFLSG